MPPTAKYYLSVSLSSKGVPDKSSLAQGTDVCTHTQTRNESFILLSAVTVAMSAFPLPPPCPHTHLWQWQV